jgi:hypothetical protein
MNATTHAYGNPVYHTRLSTNGEPITCHHPEWMPLDEIARAWASFGSEASSPAAFQATSMAFHALAFEASALRHYSSSVLSDGSGSLPSFTNTQNVEHSIADLDEAHQQWNSVLLWLDALARETRQQGEIPVSVERLSSLVLQQQQRVLSLILRVQQEYLDSHQEPLLVYLGYLPSTPEKAGQS